MADDEFKVKFGGTLIEALERFSTDPRKVLVEVGTHLVKVSQQAFRLQQRGPNKWVPRRVPNIAGALRDLEVSANVKARRFEPRPAVVDTNTLSRSFLYRHMGKRVIVFGVSQNVKHYASIQNYGGESSIVMTRTMRENLAKWIKKQRGKDKRETKKAAEQGRKPSNPVSSQFSWLFSIEVGSKITFRVKARPFIGFFQEDSDFMKKSVLRHLIK